VREQSGVVVVDKPGGMTSHDVVDEVRRLFSTRKVGHAGTLDPEATGVLVLGLGRATRLLDYARLGPKRYRAEATFGITTSTQDSSGEIVARSPAHFSEAELVAACTNFVGSIEQVPPMVSAVRVGGERLYRKALRGEEVERTPRPVVVHDLELVSFQDGPPLRAVLDVCCSAGTYVRTLVHDLGELLGCGAHLSSLRRTEAASFTLAEAIPLAELQPAHLRGPVEALRGMARLEVAGDDAARVRNGRPLESNDGPVPTATVGTGPKLVAVLSEEVLLAVYRREGARWVADRVMSS
jgi:tRNA pseudouridine55 synthase